MSALNLDEEFPLDSELVYLNHAAVSPWPRRTANAVKQFADENIHQGATNYLKWMKKEQELRQQLCRLIHAESSDDIALLKNTSEALSVVAEGIEWKAGANIVSSNQEFPSNRIPWQAQADKGVEFREVDLNHGGTPEQALMNACDEHTQVLTISSVQYASGLKMDLKTLGDFCHEHDIVFCVDAIQSIGVHTIDVVANHIDCLMADAHKWMMGPEGIAVFYCRESLRDKLTLHQFGWHMVEDVGNYDRKDWELARTSRRFECGSPNMLGIHALSASLSLIEELGQEQITAMIDKKVLQLIDALTEQGFEILSAAEDKRRSGIVTFKPGMNDPQEVYRDLMQKKLICACRGGGIRLSPHCYTGENIINKSLEVIYSSI